MTGPATTKLLIPSVVVLLGTGSNPVRAVRKCFLPAIVEIARQSSAKYHTAIVKRLWCHTEICISDTSKNEQRVDTPSHLCSRSTSFTHPRGLQQFSNPIYPNICLYRYHICCLQSTLCRGRGILGFRKGNSRWPCTEYNNKYSIAWMHIKSFFLIFSAFFMQNVKRSLHKFLGEPSRWYHRYVVPSVQSTILPVVSGITLVAVLPYVLPLLETYLLQD